MSRQGVSDRVMVEVISMLAGGLGKRDREHVRCVIGQVEPVTPQRWTLGPVVIALADHPDIRLKRIGEMVRTHLDIAS